MERYKEDGYYHGEQGEHNRRSQPHGSNYNNDFGRGHDRRDEHHFNGRSIEERRHDLSRYDNHAQLRQGNHDFDSAAQRGYQRHDRELKNAYDNEVRGEQHQLSNIRQGYGFSDQGNAGNSYYQQQQGYNSGRMGGYSGAAFGGANYSAHGGFGGAPEYGAMSGDRGNVNNYTSASGYGGGENRNAPGQGSNRHGSDRFDSRENTHRYRRNNEQNW